MKKTKILVIADHPLSPSGVGTQTKYFIEALLKTGRYKVICLGGAIKHTDYKPQRVEPYGDDWLIFPIDGYGNHEIVRSVMQKEKPDALWFMTDPRFFGWLWEIENEVRQQMPMIYYHVWDNFPSPAFNGVYYRSTDEVVCISKVTRDILKAVSPEVNSYYHPHAVDPKFYHKFVNTEEKKHIEEIRQRVLDSASEENKNPNKKIFFWNNRNARRKQSGTLIWWFKEFLDEVGHDKATLLMHTDPVDGHGQDLPHIMRHIGADHGQVLISANKVDPIHLAGMYNAADFTINISDAEGFGLSTLESLQCGTPIIVNMTGGLQEQVTNGKDWFGYGIQPSSSAVIGSLQVPYIYEDRISKDDFIKTLKSALNIRPKVYKKMCSLGQKHVADNYSFEGYEEGWVNLMDDIIERHGSWSTRKGHNRWKLLEVA